MTSIELMFLCPTPNLFSSIYLLNQELKIQNQKTQDLRPQDSRFRRRHNFKVEGKRLHRIPSSMFQCCTCSNKKVNTSFAVNPRYKVWYSGGDRR